MTKESDVATASNSSKTLGEKFNRVYKWGACPKCAGARSLQPHLLSANSKTPGKLVLYCSGWWKNGSQNGRACWFQKEFPENRKHELSRFLKDKHSDLKLSLRRNGCSSRAAAGDL